MARRCVSLQHGGNEREHDRDSQHLREQHGDQQQYDHQPHQLQRRDGRCDSDPNGSRTSSGEGAARSTHRAADAATASGKHKPGDDGI